MKMDAILEAAFSDLLKGNYFILIHISLKFIQGPIWNKSDFNQHWFG